MSRALIGDIEFTLFPKVSATFVIVHGNSPHFTIANKKSCSFFVQRSKRILKNPWIPHCNRL